MRAWLRWEAVGAYDDPEGWVRRVAHNLAVSRWRRAKKLVLRASVPTAQTEIPGEKMEIVAALQALPVAERRAIVLHHVAGLSVVDIASELRAPEGTVKSWLSRGRSRLASEARPAGRTTPESTAPETGRSTSRRGRPEKGSSR